MKKQHLLKSTLCLLLGLVCNLAWAQAVIFPQLQQPGTAVVSESGGTYSIGNDLFTAKFVKNADGDLLFGGCEAMGLMAGGEVFKVQLADGTEIPASEFTMSSITTENLTGNADAVKGSHRFDGVQIKAQFTHTNGLGIEWRAVLRDGSHYLRTEVDITTTADIAMYSITPMMYTVENEDGAKAPTVVGNTRGAVIASDKIFAGLETPMGIQTAGATTDLEKFVFKAWDGATSWAWEPADSDIPADIKSLSQYAQGTVYGSRGYVVFREAGDCTITLDYTSGSNRLQILGIDLVGLDGTVKDSDYHFGYTGGNDSNRDYTVTIPEVGAYMVRIFVTNSGTGEGFGSKGTITYNKKVAQPTLVYDLASNDTPYWTSTGNDGNSANATALHIARAAATRALSAATIASGATITDSWETSTWTAAANAPQAVLDMDYTAAQVVSIEQGLTVENAGTLGVTFTWEGGSHRLDLVGVDLVDADGNIVSGDYNRQAINSSAPANYTVAAMAGTYTLRYFVETKTESVDSNGKISIVHSAIEGITDSKKDTWTSAWTGWANYTGELTGVTATGTAKYKDQYFQMGTGKLSVLFDYTNGNHALYTLGVQVLDLNGNVVSQDMKSDKTGTNTTVTYNVTTPKRGIYILRYIVDYVANNSTDTNGDITLTFEAIDGIDADNQQKDTWEQNWTDFVDWSGTLPEGVEKTGNSKYKEKTYAIAAGKLSVLFDYTKGEHGLYVLGVQVVDHAGNVVAQDMKNGFTGSNSTVTYAMRVPVEGIYTVRYIVDKRNDGENTNGDITLSLIPYDKLGSIGEDKALTDTWESNDWKTIAAAEIPNRVNEAGCTDENARVIEQIITIPTAGTLNVEFLYESGSSRLNMVGVDLIDATGNVAVDDYHAGYTGNEKSNNVYKLNVFAPGTYVIRYFADNSEAINSTGNINLSLKVDYTLHLVAPATTPIMGMWRRQVTLKADETWNVSAVVGVIAPGQARRSFLAYSERERAVPWRAVPAYISWYELNIDRNNAQPGFEQTNMTAEQCIPVLEAWKKQLYDKYGEAPYAFVWDDGWDTYGEWQFHDGFPYGFTDMDNIGRKMGAGQGAWLGPVGGYGQSGNYRRSYWSDKGGMQLSNPAYYEVFVNAVTNLLNTYAYDFRFFKFDGISAQFSSVGPDAGATGEENAEAIIMAEKVLRSIKEDVFLNTTVGTWASPFWFQFTDAIWRQEKDYGEIGNNSNDRENWITYRDRLVYQNFVQNSPLCPINTLMTHGFIFTDFSEPKSTSRDWNAVVRELRCAFACGSGMVELYNDYELTNTLVNPATGNAGELWGEIAKCMQWQRENADVLPDIHWVGGNPWTGAKAEVYGWAAWNSKKAVLTLRNGANEPQSYTFTLREALDIPSYVDTYILLTKAFADQVDLEGLAEGTPIDIDEKLTVTLPGSSLYIFNGVDALANITEVTSVSLSTENGVQTVPVNKTLEITATVLPADATITVLEWTSSNSEIATVVGGVVKPVKEGTVTITATAIDGSGISGSIEITVTPKVYTLTVLGADGGGITCGDKQYSNGEIVAIDSESKLTATPLDGKIAIINIDGENIYLSYMDSNTQFYTIKNGKGGYMSLNSEFVDEESNIKLTNTSPVRSKKGFWAFVPQGDGGYKIYNYSTGLTKVLGMKGDEAKARASMVDPDATTYNTVFDGNIKFDGTDGRIKIAGSTSNYWNSRDGYLALWNSTGATGDDAGSKFFLAAITNLDEYPDEPLIITPEVKEEIEANKIVGVSSYSPKNPNTLWYTTSAEAAGVEYPWMEYALPLGNGELGCMVYGGVLKEEIQFNEKTLWSGEANVVGAGSGNRTFMNFGSVFIKNLDANLAESGVTDYVRYLDIEEGIAGVEFKTNGTKQVRKYLSSAPDQVIAAQYKITEGDDKLNLLFKLEPEENISPLNLTYEDGTASFIGKMTVEYAARLHVVADEGATVTTDANGIKVENATEVTFYLKGGTNFNGSVEEVDNYFITESLTDVNNLVKADIEKAITKGFTQIEEDHVADFTAITKRMTFDLGLQTPTVDTKTLVDNYFSNNANADSKANDHLFLEQLYFHYGRYLAISSNRKPIAAPNNLQGIWNDRSTDSPWNSDIHTNINIQMNYWPTEITNLSDLHKPFVNFIIRGAQSAGWKEVGKRYNDGHGWSVLTETSLYNSMSTWGDNYLVANVWYTSHLWMHWKYTQDKEFLKQAFPVLWDCAEFWFHRLIEDRGFDNTQDEQEHVRNYTPAYKYEPDGTFVAPNEFSAEQHDNQTEDGTAHAQQMIYYLFTNLKEAIDILGGQAAVDLTAEDVAKLDLYLEKTDQGLHTEPYTGAWGETYNGVKKGDKLLREWKYTPFDISNDKGHRHMSHLMALFPLDQITPESEYFTPAVNSLKLRGDAATGWSMGWKVNLWARAQDGDHAHLIIKNALKHSTSYGTNAGAGGIYYNLFDSHAPFQIDGNFGVCSGIAEMLMQSAHGYINILPALPTVWEDKGAVTGMKAMGNFTVDFNWQAGKVQQATIVSNAGAELRVRCARSAMEFAKAKITVNGTEVRAVVDENGIVTIPCAKDDKIVIDFTTESSMPATRSVVVEITDAEIATFYAHDAMTVPEGVKAYVALSKPVIEGDEGFITLTEIGADRIIPEETGAILLGAKGVYTFLSAADAASTATESNLLVGYAGTEEYQTVTLPTDATVYVLAVENEKAGFYKKDADFNVYNHKAYLQVPNEAVQGVRSLAIRFGDETTSIDNSQFTIDNSQLIYDLQGRRVVNPAKGVYIVNGKKVVIR